MAAPNPTVEPPAVEAKPQNAKPQSEPLYKKRIYIGNLPPDMSREELKELSSKCGRVISVELIRNKDKPFGFVTFLSEEDAGYAAYYFNEHMYKDYPLEASLSNTKALPPKAKVGAPRNAKDAKQKKPKKPLYSLRTLTPLNPPTQNQGVPQPMKNYTLPDDQGISQHSPNLTPFGWNDNHQAEVPHVPVSGHGPNAGQDSQNQLRNKSQEKTQGGNRKNNNNNNRNRGGGAFRRVQQETHQFNAPADNFPVQEITPEPAPLPIVVQEVQGLNQIPLTDSNTKRQKGPNPNRNSNNAPKGQPQQQKNKTGGNSAGQPKMFNASIQYTEGGSATTSNVKVNVATEKEISLNFKLSTDQLSHFLTVIQPFLTENTTQ